MPKRITLKNFVRQGKASEGGEVVDAYHEPDRVDALTLYYEIFT